MIAAIAVALAMVAPWLTVLPVHGVAATAVHLASLVAALHGAGLVVARFAGRPQVDPWLAIQWGLAALIGLSGLAIAARVGTLKLHAVLVFGFAAVHTGWLGAGFTRASERVAAALAAPRAWIVPAIALAALGGLAVLGGGDALARPFDDEGHLLAQVARVLDTGTLADPIGYPRSAQLGAQVALAAVASGAGDGVVGLIEPLAMVLALGLALSQIRGREPGAALWAAALVVAAFALALAPSDPLPCWTAVGLCSALYAMLGEADPPPALPLALIAGALIALRYELAPIAAVAVITAWWRRPFDHHRTVMLIGGVFVVGFPFLVTRMVAWRSVPAITHASLAAPAQSALILRLALAAAIAVPAAGILGLVLPDSRALRLAATATAVALGALAAHLTGAGPYSMRMVWPIAIAFAAVVVVELARSRTLGPAALITALVLCVLVEDGRDAPGRLRWSHRLAAAATGLEYAQRPPADAAPPYSELLARVPSGSTVAVWVASPEQLDYRRFRIIDLRTPVGARLRHLRWEAHASKLEALLTALSASYLLVEADDSDVQYAQSDLLYRMLCAGAPPSGLVPRAVAQVCADDLEAIALHHAVAARRDNLALIDLRR